VALARQPIDPQNRFLYHKTTNRDIYEAAHAAQPAYDDIILWNLAGEVTESTIANIVVRRRRELITPPVDCGLLAGTFRAELLSRGRIKEGIIRLEDLPQIDALYLINSVRGWMPAALGAK
jgi:para-aminobenzoate synthetase/4-amino-4-deoxychorismate lyase